MTRRGPTRKETQLSEAQSYANIASANDCFGLDIQQQHEHVLIEDRALDSYQNVLFSLTLFFTRFGVWPGHLTIVSHGFKKPRLVDGHCVAIGWPLERVSFKGIDPPGMKPGTGDNVDAMRGVAQAVGEWAADPHGRGESLWGKRQRRNPWATWQGIFGEGQDEARARSGLITKGLEGDETLENSVARPWV